MGDPPPSLAVAKCNPEVIVRGERSFLGVGQSASGREFGILGFSTTFS